MVISVIGPWPFRMDRDALRLVLDDENVMASKIASMVSPMSGLSPAAGTMSRLREISPAARLLLVEMIRLCSDVRHGEVGIPEAQPE
jgi:hypothetical protein